MRVSRFILITFLGIILSGCQQDAETPPPDAVQPAAEHAAETRAESITEAPAEDAECRLVMGWDPWEPYHFMGMGGQVQGLDIDLVRALADAADCELDLHQGAWASLLRLIQIGDLDLLVGATRTAEREQFARFSAPYRTETFELFIRPGESDRFGGEDLESLLAAGLRLGVTQGYIYSEEISRLQSDDRYRAQFIEAAVGELHFTHLLDYRIDGFLEDPFVAAAIQRRRGWQDQIQALPLELESGEVHIMFSRETVEPEIVRRFDDALQALRDSGEYDAILAPYMMD